jgi:hypothetical protein
VDGGTQVSIVDSEIANNSVGVKAMASGSTLQATVAHSTLTNNDTALDVISDLSGNASVLVDGNTITYSNTVFKLEIYPASVAAIFTAGNNTVGYYGTLTQGGVLAPCCNN